MTFDVNGWNQAPDDGSFAPTEAPPDGLYEILVTDFRADTAKSGNAYLAVDLQAVNGPHTGHVWSIIGGFGSPGAIGMSKATCTRLGVQTAHPAIIHAATPQASLEALSQLGKQAAVGHWFAVRVERSKEVKADGQPFVNTYVESRLAPATQPPPTQTAPMPHTDVPADVASFQPQPQPQPGQPSYVQPVPSQPPVTQPPVPVGGPPNPDEAPF